MNEQIKHLGRMFVRGLMAILPIAVTLFILFWLGEKAESILGGMIKILIPNEWYIPGMGVVAGLLITLAAGASLQVWAVRKAFAYSETVMSRLPVIKLVYGAVRDLTDFFDKSKKRQFNKTVLVDLCGGNLRALGFVTREDFSQLPDSFSEDDRVAVYMPWSYQVGGLTFLVPRSCITPIDMSIDRAMRFAVTAGVSTSVEGQNNSPEKDFSPEDENAAKE